MSDLLTSSSIHGLVHDEFAYTFTGLVMSQVGKRDVEVTAIRGLYPANVRNETVRQFLESKHEWLFTADVDMTFPANTLDLLHEAADATGAKIITGLYFGFLANFDANDPRALWFHDVDGRERENVEAIFEHQYYELSACGAGCMLIHREVFEKIAAMRPPYSEDEWVWYGHDLDPRPGHQNHHMGEDVTFCVRAKAAGYKIIGVSDAICDHIKYRKIGWNSMVERYGCKTAIAPPHPADEDLPEGWLSKDEAAYLAERAKGKTVLDIGVFKGRSTVAMARTAERVFSIDHFKGTEGEHKDEDYFPVFIENIKNYGVSERVVPMICDLAQTISLPKADFAFLDGAHDEASVRRDAALAIAAVGDVENVVFDDYGWPGVKAVVDEYAAARGQRVERIGKMAYICGSSVEQAESQGNKVRGTRSQVPSGKRVSKRRKVGTPGA